ncbi:MAG: DNA cytosine methyltransferase [Synergistaceae bacterium]|nr:DNA cytosine methyltransferase [Synergistaceae bacterium]
MKQMSIFYKDEDSSFSEICEFLGIEGNAPAWPDAFGKRISQYLSENNITPIKTLSLFSGAGGLDIGFSDVGFDIVESVEIESKFCDTLILNSGEGKQFKDTRVNCIDIRNYTAQDIGKIDFIIGGPPCQTFSAAGRRANGVLGTTDSRGVLFREYVRLLKELDPVGFLFENVYGIVGAQNGKPWEEIKESFSDAGYRLFYRILDAADYGVPQHRERLIIVGLKEGTFLFPRPTHGPDSIDDQPFYNAETAIEGVELTKEEAKRGIGGRCGNLLDDIPPGLNYSFYTEEMGHPKPVFAWRSKFSDFLYKADPNEPVRTIKASGGAYTGPFHWENRFFAYSEYKRLQTFPDNYEISGAKPTAVKQIVNSVPPQMARIMAIAIRQQVFNTPFPFTLSLLQDGEELTFRKRKKELTAVYRKKAKMAIESMKQEKEMLPDSRAYYCLLDTNFDYKILPEKSAKYRVDVKWEVALQIQITDLFGNESDKWSTITITPRNGEWNLGVTKAVITINSDNDDSFTVGWKAFEQELIDNAIKADIVQLNGYYQYSPKLLCQYDCSKPTMFDEILQDVVGGECVGRILSTETLAKRWNIPADSVIGVAERLRSYGYEIRNHNTNPQINEGEWLLPYSFPTLTKLSVQLRKKVSK